MTVRPLLLSGAMSVLASACSVQGPRVPASNEFAAVVARLERTDPASPALLSAKLGYADFLLSAAPGPCAERLVRAQEQVGSVEADPTTPVMFPDGLARAADLEYRLHLARSACGLRADDEDELRAAAAAAHRAVELYRDVFDYRSMVILQSDASMVLHQLGETAAALSGVQAALQMDREYGFHDDARENYQLLLAWRGEASGPAQIARLMQDFPNRRATLKFGWHPANARITLESRREYIKDGQPFRSRAAAAFELHIGAEPGGGWSVSYTDRLARYEPGVWPTIASLNKDSQAPQTVFPPAPIPPVGFTVSAAGQFQAVTDSEAFAARLVDRTDLHIRAQAPSGMRAHGLTNDAVEMTADVLSPGALEAATAESYALDTAMWIGATLEQGIWYETSAPLSLPGIPRIVIPHRIAFAFTRMVPCAADAAPPRCIEIVIRITPDRQALDDVNANTVSLHYAASIEGRIVTDPATLLPYAREERIFWYYSFGPNRQHTTLKSEHLVSRTHYESNSPVSPTVIKH